MAMTASSGVAQGAGNVSAGQAERSPFLRTTELLAPYQPTKPLITLSLGEPQHPVPDFVGPVLAQQNPRSEETRLNSSHMSISYAVFCLKKKKKNTIRRQITNTTACSCSACST